MQYTQSKISAKISHFFLGERKIQALLNWVGGQRNPERVVLGSGVPDSKGSDKSVGANSNGFLQTVINLSNSDLLAESCGEVTLKLLLLITLLQLPV